MDVNLTIDASGSCQEEKENGGVDQRVRSTTFLMNSNSLHFEYLGAKYQKAKCQKEISVVLSAENEGPGHAQRSQLRCWAPANFLKPHISSMRLVDTKEGKI